MRLNLRDVDPIIAGSLIASNCLHAVIILYDLTNNFSFPFSMLSRRTIAIAADPGLLGLELIVNR